MNWSLHLIESDIKALEQLRPYRHWVVWRRKLRDSKFTKVPFMPDGRPAKPNDPKTWSDLDSVLQKANKFDGIGFVFSDDDPFVFIDLDHVLDENGRIRSAWARELLQAIESYTEISPSGDGLHIYTKGIIPQSIRHKRTFDDGSALEVYIAGRYSTITLNVFDGRDTIKEADLSILEKFLANDKQPPKQTTSNLPSNLKATLQANDRQGALSDEEIINKLIEKGVWRVPEAGEDHSALDQSLCNHLAFWTNKDPGRMDRLFRRSPLYRRKWDERHRSDGATYGQMTIERAIADTPSGYESRVSSFSAYEDDDFWFEEFSDEEITKMTNAKYLFKNLIVEGFHTMLVGKAGSLKSTIAAYVGLEIAKKREKQVHYWGFDPSNVFLAGLYLQAKEEGLKKWLRTPKNPTSNEFREIYKQRHDLSQVIVIIDTFSFLTDGIIDKNANKRAMEFLRNMIQRGATILSLSHTNKDGKEYAGTSELEQLSDAMLKIEAVDKGDHFIASIDKYKRVRYMFDQPLNFKVTKTPRDIKDEIERVRRFIKSVEFLGEGVVDVAKEAKLKEKIEKHRYFIESVQAILRHNGGKMIQKELLEAIKEDLGMGKDKAIKFLNDGDFLNRFWRTEYDREYKNRKYFILIDTTQRTIDNINQKLKASTSVEGVA